VNQQIATHEAANAFDRVVRWQLQTLKNDLAQQTISGLDSAIHWILRWTGQERTLEAKVAREVLRGLRAAKHALENAQ
jgi:hypothetical protein